MRDRRIWLILCLGVLSSNCHVVADTYYVSGHRWSDSGRYPALYPQREQPAHTEQNPWARSVPPSAVANQDSYQALIPGRERFISERELRELNKIDLSSHQSRYQQMSRLGWDPMPKPSMADRFIEEGSGSARVESGYGQRPGYGSMDGTLLPSNNNMPGPTGVYQGYDMPYPSFDYGLPMQDVAPGNSYIDPFDPGQFGMPFSGRIPTLEAFIYE